MKLILGALKGVITIVASAILFFFIHDLIITPQFDSDGIDRLVLKQHLFLCSISLFIYLFTYISFQFLPNKAGFVFLGLIMAKMIVSGFFLYSIGLLEDGVPMYKKAFFLLFYMLYSLILVYFCVLKFKGESNDLESNN